MLLVVTFEYGPRGPEGICTQRLVHALREQAADVRVITAASFNNASEALVEHVPVRTLRPCRIQELVGNVVVGAPVAGWDWVIHASARSLTGRHVVYGRGNPPASLLAAYRLARNTGQHLVSHFSDPIPSPWDAARGWRFDRTVANMRAIIDASRLLTFTTQEAVDYMCEVYKTDLANKSVVVPNIVPDWPCAPGQGAHRNEVAYIGSFGGPRLPDPLARCILLYNSRNQHAAVRLVLVGTAPSWVNYLRTRYPALGVDLRERTSDVLHYYLGSAITAVVDADDTQPVFLATKTAESIHAANRLLIISPEGSPARRLFANRWSSVGVSDHDPENASRVLSDLLRCSGEDIQREIPSRQAALADFRSEAVARRFLESLRSKALS